MKEINERSHVGGVGCQPDEVHRKIDDPSNWYPSWQTYWIVSLVVRSGWITSLWVTIGGVSHDFSMYLEIKPVFQSEKVPFYFDKQASFLTKVHFPDRLVLYLFQLIEIHHYKKTRWYSDNRIVLHLRIHLVMFPVSHNQSLINY